MNAFEGHTCTQYKIDSHLLHTDATVLSGSEDGMVYFWDLIEAKIVHKLEAHKGVVYSLSRHPKSSVILTAGTDSVKLWGTEERQGEG